MQPPPVSLSSHPTPPATIHYTPSPTQNYSIMISSKDFNSNWLVKVQWQEINCLVGYASLVSLLDDCAEKVLARVEASKAEKLVCKPFHGAIITFYAR